MASGMFREGTRRYGVTERVAISAVSAPSALAYGSEEVCLHNGDTATCFVKRGPGTPIADLTTCMALAPGEKFHMQIDAGDKIAVIGTAGFLYITPTT